MKKFSADALRDLNAQHAKKLLRDIAYIYFEGEVPPGECATLHPVNVEFLADCDWHCTLRGEAVKFADETRESMRARALDDFRQELLVGGATEEAV